MFSTVGTHQHSALLLFPRASADLLLASLKQIAVMQEKRLHLVDAARRHKDEVENCKDTQL